MTGTLYHALERGELASGVRGAPASAPYLRVDSLPVEPLEESEEIPEEESEALIAGEEEGEEELETRPPQERRDERGPRRRGGAEEDAEGAPRMRRRRRRRGRGGQGAPEPAQLDADQPSDEGLAFMAQIGGVPAQK